MKGSAKFTTEYSANKFAKQVDGVVTKLEDGWLVTDKKGGEMMSEYEESSREFPYRIKIQQSAKGFSYWEVSIKSDDLQSLKEKLKECVKTAKEQCDELNKILV